MPTSDASNIAPIVERVKAIEPQSILELGIGYGKYGALLREYLDCARGRYRPEDWKVQIIGVEGFEPYRNPMWEMYTVVHVNDFSNTPRSFYSGFDVVLLIDSLEHIHRRCGEELLQDLTAANENVIVSVPDSDVRIGEQGAWGGNELEMHRAHWGTGDLLRMGGVVFHRGRCVVAHFTGGSS